jgi:hypothetical protein
MATTQCTGGIDPFGGLTNLVGFTEQIISSIRVVGPVTSFLLAR